MLIRIILLQTLDRFINIGTFLFVFSLYLSLLNNFIFSLLLYELVNSKFFLLLQGFKLHFAIVEYFFDLWIQVFEVFLKFSFHQRCIFRWATSFLEDLAKLCLVAQFDSEVGMLVHFIDKVTNFLNIIVTLGCCSAGQTTLSSWINNTTQSQLKPRSNTTTRRLAGIPT